ncbi:hypothetical protein QFC21_001880 [Naganishia friedmannii]|uniref:Uncharacterized protein n=1 Tax=Naganishia friedmannii TaxID=89922 RepID=A0ACC2W2Q9_9TREE|nr:hypothetical protein QFC21_001880 [Naganishia friedmannii]
MMMQKTEPEMAAPLNISSVSLFSPWQALYSNVNPFFTPPAANGQGNATVFPFPSPSLGFTMGDNVVPWPDLSVFNGFTPGTAGMPNVTAPAGANGFPFPQHHLNPSAKNRKESLQSTSSERLPVSRIDSASSGVSSSAVSVALQSSTPETTSVPIEQQTSAPMHQVHQQGLNRFQPSDFTQMHQGFSMGRTQMQLNTMPPTYQHLHQQHFHQSSVEAGWSQFQTYSTQDPPYMMPNQSTGQQTMGAPVMSRSASLSNQHSSISPAMLSNAASRMPGRPSAFYNQAEDDDVLVTVASSAAPSEYGGQTLSSRNPSPEPAKKSRKRPASGPQGHRGHSGEVEMGSDGISGEDDDAEGDPEPEGVERNGMMWGMKTEEYKALSARERKRVRNRISARTFRARRKEHLTVLESDLAERNAMLKAFQEEIRRLGEENSQLSNLLVMQRFYNTPNMQLDDLYTRSHMVNPNPKPSREFTV